jgi:hypothetical protein
MTNFPHSRLLFGYVFSLSLPPPSRPPRNRGTAISMAADRQGEDALLDAVAVIRIGHPDSTPKQVHGMLVRQTEWAGMSISAVKRACCKVAKLGILSGTVQASQTPYTDWLAEQKEELALLTLPDALLALVCESVDAEDAACFKASTKRLYEIFKHLVPDKWVNGRRMGGCPPVPIAAVFRSASRLAWALEGGFFTWLQGREERDSRSNGCKLATDPRCCLLARAAECGELADLKLLHASYPWDERTTRAATVRGRLDILRFAVEGGCKIFLTRCKKEAAFNGHQALLEYMASLCDGASLAGLDLHDKPGELCAHAASGGHLELLKWLRSHGCEWGRTITAAARRGHIAIVQYAIGANCPLSSEALYPGGFVVAAAESGNTDLVRLAAGPDRCLYDGHSKSRTVSLPMWYSAQHGNLAMMQFLHSRGHPFDWRMVNEAAGSKPQSQAERLALAQFLHARAKAEDFTTRPEHAVRWEEFRWLRVAATRNELEIIKWFQEEALTEGRSELGQVERAEICVAAARHGHTAVVEYARQHGCSWGYVYEEVLRGPLDHAACLKMLQWLYRQGAPLRPAIWGQAFNRGELQFLQWLQRIECPMDMPCYCDPYVPRALLRWAVENDVPLKFREDKEVECRHNHPQRR